MKSVRTYTMVVDHSLQGADALELCERAARLPFDAIGELHLSHGRVDAVDASGVAAIVRLFSHLTCAGKRLVLTDVPEAIFRLLADAGLTGVMPVVASASPVFDLPVAEASGLHEGSQLF